MRIKNLRNAKLGFWLFIALLLNLVLFALMLVFPSIANAKTVKIGDIYYVTGNKTVSLAIDIADSGVGMRRGKSKFGIKYTDTDEDVIWFDKRDYSKDITLGLDVESNRKFELLGLFADSLGNWMVKPVNIGVLLVDDDPPSGGKVIIKVDIDVGVTVEVK